MRIKYCTCLRRSEQNSRYDSRWYIPYCIPCIFMTDMTSRTSFFLFHLVFELLDIFRVMVDIVKIQLVSANENCMLNIFFSIRFFLSTELFVIYPILIWSRSRCSDIVWTNVFYDILSNEWELKVFINIFFWRKCFHRVLLLEELKCEDYIWPFDNIKKFL